MSTRRSEREFFISSRLVPQLVFYLEKANLPYYRVSNYCVLVQESALSRLGDVLLEAGAFMFDKSERTRFVMAMESDSSTWRASVGGRLDEVVSGIQSDEQSRRKLAFQVMKEIYQRAFQVIKEKMEDFSEIPYFNFSFVCENGNEMTFGVDIPKVIFKGVSFSEYEDVAQQFLSQITEGLQAVKKVYLDYREPPFLRRGFILISLEDVPKDVAAYSTQMVVRRFKLPNETVALTLYPTPSATEGIDVAITKEENVSSEFIKRTFASHFHGKEPFIEKKSDSEFVIYLSSK